MRRALLGLASVVALPLAFYACAGDDPAAPGPKPLSDAAFDAGISPDSAPAETGATVGGCSQTDFDAPPGANGGDFTALPNVDVTFPTGSTPAPYTNRCAKVKVGSTVTFKGSFSNHPLQPSGGDVPTPILLTSADVDGGSVVVTMPVKGTYGYECMFHPSIMLGAIQVVP